jgi:hypothetical protein
MARLFQRPWDETIAKKCIDLVDPSVPRAEAIDCGVVSLAGIGSLLHENANELAMNLNFMRTIRGLGIAVDDMAQYIGNIHHLHVQQREFIAFLDLKEYLKNNLEKGNCTILYYQRRNLSAHYVIIYKDLVWENPRVVDIQQRERFLSLEQFILKENSIIKYILFEAIPLADSAMNIVPEEAHLIQPSVQIYKNIMSQSGRFPGGKNKRTKRIKKFKSRRKKSVKKNKKYMIEKKSKLTKKSRK